MRDWDIKYTLQEWLGCMTDFGISERVAESLKISWHMNPSHPLNTESDSWAYSERQEEIATPLKDYCNDPSAAWPLILEEGISLIYQASGAMEGAWIAGPILSKIGVAHKNPLRAAMVAYLLLKQEKGNDRCN